MPALTLVAPDISYYDPLQAHHRIGTRHPDRGRTGARRAARQTVRVIYDDTLVSELAIRERLDDIGYPVGV